MILINFYLNNKNISKNISFTLSAEELLEDIFHSNNTLNKKINNDFTLILLDLRLVYSKIIPAFMLNGCNVFTLEGIKNTKIYQYILNILREEDLSFCKDCFAVRILLFYYFIKNEIIKKKSDILDYYSVIKCNCIGVSDFVDIYLKIDRFEKYNE